MIVSVLLMITVAWSLWDEMYGLRPWRDYQKRFANAYRHYLDKDVAREKKLESDVYNSSPNTRSYPATPTLSKKPPSRKTTPSPSKSRSSTLSAPPSAMPSKTLAAKSATSSTFTKSFRKRTSPPKPRP